MARPKAGHAFDAYKITCSANGKAYIGITSQGIRKRYQQHIRRAQSSAHGPDWRTFLSKAVKKHGANAFIVEHLASARSFDDLLELEILLVAQHETFHPFGYNRTWGGEGMLGHSRPLSEAEKQRIRATLTGRTLTPQHKANIASGVSASITEERRRAVGNFHRGRKRPQSTIEAISAALTGRKRNPASVAKMVATKTGQRASKATRDQMVEAQKVAWINRKLKSAQI